MPGTHKTTTPNPKPPFFLPDSRSCCGYLSNGGTQITTTKTLVLYQKRRKQQPKTQNPCFLPDSRSCCGYLSNGGTQKTTTKTLFCCARNAENNNPKPFFVVPGTQKPPTQSPNPFFVPGTQKTTTQTLLLCQKRRNPQPKPLFLYARNAENNNPKTQNPFFVCQKRRKNNPKPLFYARNAETPNQNPFF